MAQQPYAGCPVIYALYSVATDYRPWLSKALCAVKFVLVCRVRFWYFILTFSKLRKELQNFQIKAIPY
jgi:hypothetical protein